MFKNIGDGFKTIRRRVEYLLVVGVLICLALPQGRERMEYLFNGQFVDPTESIAFFTMLGAFFGISVLRSAKVYAKYILSAVATLGLFFAVCVKVLGYKHILYTIPSTEGFAILGILVFIIWITYDRKFAQHFFHFVKYGVESIAVAYITVCSPSLVREFWNAFCYIVRYNAFIITTVSSGFMVLVAATLVLQTLKAVIFHIKRSKKGDNYVPTSELPHIGVIVPAYNEEKVIVETIDSLLNALYPQDKLDIYLVDDGSKDGTVAKVLSTYLMTEDNLTSYQRVSSSESTKTYTSSRRKNLHLIVKPNGGKFDALNCGINHLDENITWFLGVDADCRIHDYAIKHLAREITFAGKDTVALTGTVLSSNVNASTLTKIQQLEYANSFYLNRASSALSNNMMIVSGAFGLFRLADVVQIGGYKKGLGEDMHITLDLQKSKKNKVVYVPESIMFTQMPDSIDQLKKQRKRWFKGLAENLSAFFHFAFKPKMAMGFWEYTILEFLSPLSVPVGVLFIIANPSVLLNPTIYMLMGSFVVLSFIQCCLSSHYLYKYSRNKISPLYILLQTPISLLSTLWRCDALLDMGRKSWDHLDRLSVKKAN